MVRPRSNALTAGDPRLPHWFDPAYQLHIANAGPYHPDPSGYKVFNGTRHHATEGWKFHVSAYGHNAEALAGVLLPLLTAGNVYHKYLELNVLRTRTGVETGKFIAYYPISPQDAHHIAAAIGNAIAGAGLVNQNGPTIQDEMPFGATGILYTRYGSYAYEYIKGPPNENTCSLDPPRGVRAYHVGRVRPTWIPDLTTDVSNTLFPTYDARRTLRGLPESNATWVN